ncbi:minor capsid protein [Anoxybacteroides amylolyticum]|uniref:Phage head morphogenesis, SPP1 gp7 family domain protein n=1 Tax=Anoxybacteroides amylolyticum TaxID=294699 RepID=A0A160F7J4_9BACL|nr:minor capsid protein [Anoxybacillus amylolyticus]ANB62095.1 phage head morphogenesis, SPP1 gp7 family domain protein [Anoxybacillus amylolyticus]
MNSRQYWEQRATQREQEAKLIVDRYLAQMQQRLKEAQQDILRQIEAFYARYARDNRISMHEAKQVLTSQEIKEFQQVDLARFRAMALEGNPQYENLLNAISYRVRISRLELLLAQIEMTMLHLYGGKNGLQEYTYTGLVDVYQNSYYHFMYDFAMAGIPADVQILDDSTMREVMLYNWSGKEFSERIWGHEQETMQNIRKSLEQSFIIGRSIDKTAKEIVKVTDVAYSRAEALVRTEASFFHNLAAQNSYRDAGMEKYEILATLDMRTSDICRYQDGKVYNVKDYKPGTNAPPFHVRCRTTTIPYFDESEYTKGEKRQSMNGLVDSVSYEEWLSSIHQKSDRLYVPESQRASKVIPNIERAIFIDQKLTNYALDKNHKSGGPKAVLFDELLGYNLSNWQDLKNNILKELPHSFARYNGSNNHGDLYESIMKIKGPTGREAYVLVSWIIGKREKEPRLTSAYIIDEKKAKKKMEGEESD